MFFLRRSRARRGRPGQIARYVAKAYHSWHELPGDFDLEHFIGSFIKTSTMLVPRSTNRVFLELGDTKLITNVGKLVLAILTLEERLGEESRSIRYDFVHVVADELESKGVSESHSFYPMGDPREGSDSLAFEYYNNQIDIVHTYLLQHVFIAGVTDLLAPNDDEEHAQTIRDIRAASMERVQADRQREE